MVTQRERKRRLGGVWGTVKMSFMLSGLFIYENNRTILHPAMAAQHIVAYSAITH